MLLFNDCQISDKYRWAQRKLMENILSFFEPVLLIML